MIHRAPLGSMERFMGTLIEHFTGAVPTLAGPWAGARAADLRQGRRLLAAGAGPAARDEVSGHAGSAGRKVGDKIRDAQLEKIPAMLVVGVKEAEDHAVSYRDRVDGDRGAMPLDEALSSGLTADATAAAAGRRRPPPSAADGRARRREPRVLRACLGIPETALRRISPPPRSTPGKTIGFSSFSGRWRQ